MQYTQPTRTGPQPHNQIGQTADEQLHRALIGLPTDLPAESWLGRHNIALEGYVAGKGLDAIARTEALMATEVMLAIRTADRLYGETLRAMFREILFADDGSEIRALLREVLTDVVAGLIDALLADVYEVAGAVADLERRVAVAA
jgi:hypothetical protein